MKTAQITRNATSRRSASDSRRSPPLDEQGRGREKAGPRHAAEPDDREEEPERLLALRLARREAQQVLVDEVEPREVGGARGRQQVPRRGYAEEERHPSQPRHRRKHPPLAGRPEVEEDHRARDRDPDQPLRQHRQRRRREHPVPPQPPRDGRRSRSPGRGAVRDPEARQRRGEEERHRHVECGEAGEADPQRRGAERHGRHGAGAPAAHRGPERIRERHAREAKNRAPETRGERRQAEGLDRGRREPVVQRRLLEVEHAVQVRGDELPGRQHFARDLGVASLVRLEQRRAAEPPEDEHDQARDDEHRQQPGRRPPRLRHSVRHAPL